MLNRVIARVHAAVQESRSREEFELGSITLQLLSLLRQGREATLDIACSEAHGCAFTKWQQRTMERTSALAWELQQQEPATAPGKAHAFRRLGNKLGPANGPAAQNNAPKFRAHTYSESRIKWHLRRVQN